MCCNFEIADSQKRYYHLIFTYISQKIDGIYNLHNIDYCCIHRL